MRFSKVHDKRYVKIKFGGAQIINDERFPSNKIRTK